MGRKPLVVGHRGAAGEAPENTLTAIGVAIAAGADAIEIDLRLSRDGAVVVIHDATLDRTAGAAGRIAELSLKDIRRARIETDEHVPTLDEVLDYVAGRCAVFCEVKVDVPGAEANAKLIEATIEAIRRHGAEAWSAIHSFDPAVVGAARAARPAVCAAVISPPVSLEGAQALFERALRMGAQAISVHHATVGEQLVSAAHLRHLTTWAWTADAVTDWERLAAAGVDGIITNLPTRLGAYLIAG